jgi:signal transduction histidine kinase
MSSQELIHSISNELAVVLGRAELLSQAPQDPEKERACMEIKRAARNIHRLLRDYTHRSPAKTGS